MGKTRENNGGVGIGAVVLVVFIVLKLVGVIDWSWWWVLSPLWVGLAAIVAGIVLYRAGAKGMGRGAVYRIHSHRV